MKKFLLILSLFGSNCLFALPCGNPVMPRLIKEGFFISPTSWANVRIGYEGDFVSDGRLDQSKEGSGRVDSFKLNSNSGSLTLNLQNRCDFFALCGIATIKSDWRITTSPDTFYKIEMESKRHFTWSGGAKVVVFEWGNFSLGLDGRYAKTKPKMLWITKNGAALAKSGSRISWRSWQVDLALSYKIDFLIPYLGAKYSHTKASVRLATDEAISDSGENRVHMKTREGFGTALGCSFTNGKIFSFNVEARLIDEEALTVSGEIRF